MLKELPRLNISAKSGKAKGQAYATKRAQAMQLKDAGNNHTQIAKQLEVDRRTVIRWFAGV